MVERYRTFAELSDRLTQIADQVKSKETSLEHNLDLLDEAVELSSQAVELVDKGGFTDEENERLAEPDEAPDDGAEEG